MAELHRQTARGVIPAAGAPGPRHEPAATAVSGGRIRGPPGPPHTRPELGRLRLHRTSPVNEERLGSYFLAERSHLTFAEYLPRAATGAPARPFARHTRGLSRPRGHRFCLKGQKSPTHSKRSPAGHQGERDRGAERAGGSTTWAQQGPGPWVPSTRHTTRKTRYGIGTDRMDEPGPPGRCPRARPVPRRAGGVNRPRNAAPTLSRRASRPFPGPGRHPALRTHFLCGLQGDGVARSLWQRGRGRGARSFRRRVGPHGYGRRGTENLRPGPAPASPGSP